MNNLKKIIHFFRTFFGLYGQNQPSNCPFLLLKLPFIIFCILKGQNFTILTRSFINQSINCQTDKIVSSFQLHVTFFNLKNSFVIACNNSLNFIHVWLSASRLFSLTFSYWTRWRKKNERKIFIRKLQTCKCIIKSHWTSSFVPATSDWYKFYDHNLLTRNERSLCTDSRWSMFR